LILIQSDRNLNDSSTSPDAIDIKYHHQINGNSVFRKCATIWKKKKEFPTRKQG